MVPRAENIGIDPVEPFEGARGRFPHLDSGLVGEFAVRLLQPVRLDQIADADHLPNVEFFAVLYL